MYFFFFFKQKTAYEIMPSLVGSEMCIRDRHWTEGSVDPSSARNQLCICCRQEGHIAGYPCQHEGDDYGPDSFYWRGIWCPGSLERSYQGNQHYVSEALSRG